MHLNGIGAVRNCKMAVELLKRAAGLSTRFSGKLVACTAQQHSIQVCERGGWVSGKCRSYIQKRLSSVEGGWLVQALQARGSAKPTTCRSTAACLAS